MRSSAISLPASSRQDKDVLVPVNMAQPLRDALTILHELDHAVADDDVDARRCELQLVVLDVADDRANVGPAQTRRGLGQHGSRHVDERRPVPGVNQTLGEVTGASPDVDDRGRWWR